MVVLGMDTATPDAVVGVTAGGELVHESRVEPGPDGRPRHSQVLLPEIERSVEAAGGWERIERIAVGIGPGSFTGLRIGIATARALAHARGIAVRPVSSLAALADPLDPSRPRLPLIDARRGELFAALHEAGDVRWPPFVAPPEALAERVGKAFPGAVTPIAAGDGAIKFRAALEAVGVEVPSDESQLHVVRAQSVCHLALGGTATPPEAVLPDYLREPDAKPRLLP
jgi:tRNA threonylcarbamoyladenosine biosynthesis protein TsaB